MKCEKCGNEYSSQYYFATPTICNDCFRKMPHEEQQMHMQAMYEYQGFEQFPYRVGFGSRFGAAFINFLVFIVIYMIAIFMTDLPEMVQGMDIQDLTDMERLQQNEGLFQEINYISSVLMYSIFIIMFISEILVGTNLGKLIFRLKIASQDMKNANISTLFIRFLIKHSWIVLSFLGFITGVQFFGLIGFLAMLVIFIGCFFTLGQSKLAFHDMAAGTAVFRASDVRDNQSTDMQQGTFS